MKSKPIIKTGFCVAYDWQLLENSLPRVYESSDIICLALDKQRKSWSGNTFSFNEKEFDQLINRIDREKKIIVYEDDFFLPGLTARENCNRHRTMIADKMGEGGWHIQVDSDEYFLDFEGFTKYLISLNPYPTGKEKPYNVHVYLYDLFKRLDDGYLYIYPKSRNPFSAPFATTKPNYVRARHNEYFNKISPFYVIHETWARGESELRFKLSNWGHSSEELKNPLVRESMINLWKAADKYNYKYIKDFHFLIPHGWEGLEYVQANNIQEFVSTFKPRFKVSPLDLIIGNSRLFGHARYFYDRLKIYLTR